MIAVVKHHEWFNQLHNNERHIICPCSPCNVFAVSVNKLKTLAVRAHVQQQQRDNRHNDGRLKTWRVGKSTSKLAKYRALVMFAINKHAF